MKIIKVGYLVSYDYTMLLTSLKQVYDYADRIYIAIDKDLKTWSGNNFEIPQSFYEEIKQFDSYSKIEYYFDSFYVPELSPLMCETRERNLLAKRMGRGWLIQLDVDEYVYDFKQMVLYLQRYWYFTIFPKLTPIVFRGKLVTLFKEVSDGYLYIDNNERFPFITNIPEYSKARFNNLVRNHFTNVSVIHQSWARSSVQIHEKVNNWGHRDDFDTSKYIEFWNLLNSSNYKNYKNIHPLAPEVWNKLHFLPSESIEDFIFRYSQKNKQKLIFIEPRKILRALINKILK